MQQERFDEQALMLESLAASVTQAKQTVEAGRLAMETRIEQAEAAEEARKKAADVETQRKNRNTLVLAGLIVLVGLIVAGAFSLRTKHIADDAREAAADALAATNAVEDALAQFEADRIDRSVNACLDRNAIRIGMNKLALAAGGHDEFGNPTELFINADPSQQARAQDFLSFLLPLQICTEDQIDLFLTSGRTQGINVIDGSDGAYTEAVTDPTPTA